MSLLDREPPSVPELAVFFVPRLVRGFLLWEIIRESRSSFRRPSVAGEKLILFSREGARSDRGDESARAVRKAGQARRFLRGHAIPASSKSAGSEPHSHPHGSRSHAGKNRHRTLRPVSPSSIKALVRYRVVARSKIKTVYRPKEQTQVDIRTLLPVRPAEEETVSYRLRRKQGQWMLFDPPLPRVAASAVIQIQQEEADELQALIEKESQKAENRKKMPQQNISKDRTNIVTLEAIEGWKKARESSLNEIVLLKTVLSDDSHP